MTIRCPCGHTARHYKSTDKALLPDLWNVVHWVACPACRRNSGPEKTREAPLEAFKRLEEMR